MIDRKTRILSTLLFFACVLIVNCQSASNSGEWDPYARDMSNVCRADQHKVMEQYRCEMFDKCCKEQAKLEDCQKFDMVDCKKLVCKVSNCTLALTTMSTNRISGAPARVQQCVGVVLFAATLLTFTTWRSWTARHAFRREICNRDAFSSQKLITRPRVSHT